jgi:hypothetical protein
MVFLKLAFPVGTIMAGALQISAKVLISIKSIRKNAQSVRLSWDSYANYN